MNATAPTKERKALLAKRASYQAAYRRRKGFVTSEYEPGRKGPKPKFTREEKLARWRARNMQPEVKARRQELIWISRQDPVKLAAQRKRACEYFLANKQKVYSYRKEQRRTNPQYQISSNLRTYIYQKVGQKKGGPESRFISVVGCSVAALCDWLEKHFTDGMSWKNYGKGDGKWSIDHTKPCASYDLTDDAQVKACFHYSNLKPMWWRDNLIKKAKIVNLY